MDKEQAIIEFANAMVHLDRLIEECEKNEQYALAYSLHEFIRVQRMLLKVEQESKPERTGGTDNG